LSKLPSKKKLNNSKQNSFKDSALTLDPLIEEPHEEMKGSRESIVETGNDNFFYK